MSNDSIIKWEDTLEFTFPITGGQVIKCYDADTITIATKLPFQDSPMYRLSVRLNGIDTPEIKPKKTIPNRDAHITKAKEARDFLSGLVLNKSIRIKFLHNDLYGRPLVYLYQENTCINDLMIEKGFAKKYDGGTKDNDF